MTYAQTVAAKRPTLDEYPRPEPRLNQQPSERALRNADAWADGRKLPLRFTAHLVQRQRLVVLRCQAGAESPARRRWRLARDGAGLSLLRDTVLSKQTR
jgi:hypothetical protein